MYFPQSLLVLVCLYKCVFADPYTISLGDIHTYAVSVTTSTPLTGTTLSVELLSTATSAAIPPNGANFILSPDLQTSVNSILAGSDCGSKDSACKQALSEAFSRASLDIVARQLPVIPLIILGLVLSEIAAGIGLYLGIFKANEGIFLPPQQLSQMAAAATATEIAFATGTAAPYASITMVSALITTTPKVSFVTATASAYGQSVSDIIISLPPDLASRMQEIIARESCFGLSKRTGDISNAICGGQALVFESQPGGTLFELQLIQGIAGANPFNLQWATDTLNNGANQVIEYAGNLAAVLRLTPDAAAALGALAFAFALLQDVNGQNLQALNTIPASAIGTMTMSQCAVTSCFAGYDMTGAIQRCSTTCMTTSTAGNCNTSPTITTTAFSNIPTGPIQSTTCNPTSTLFPISLQSMNGLFGTQYYYTCGDSWVGINLAVSGTSTLSYPANGEEPPIGFTQIPASNGKPYTTPPRLQTTQPPFTFSPPYSLPSVTLVVSSKPKATSQYCDPYWCGALFCGPCITGTVASSTDHSRGVEHGYRVKHKN